MADNFRILFVNAVISSDRVPTTGAGSASGDALRDGGLNAVNLWGTGKGVGVPANRAMLALDGVPVLTVNVATALKENDPIYITAANALTTVATGNTLFGYSDDAKATGATQRVGVRISNAVGA